MNQEKLPLNRLKQPKRSKLQRCVNLKVHISFLLNVIFYYCIFVDDIKVQAKKPPVKTAALKKAAQSSGLRISFKPADLGKTTDKNMAAQVDWKT